MITTYKCPLIKELYIGRKIKTSEDEKTLIQIITSTYSNNKVGGVLKTYDLKYYLFSLNDDGTTYLIETDVMVDDL